MLDFSSVEIQQIINHYVGNQVNEEPLNLSESTITMDDNTTMELPDYLLNPFIPADFHSLAYPENNRIFNMVDSIFENPAEFIPKSRMMATWLADVIQSPKVAGGDITVAHFVNVGIGDDVVDAIGIFKSERKLDFINFNMSEIPVSIDTSHGYTIKGVDIGVIIFNINKEDGYNLLTFDKINKLPKLQYWKNEFLDVKPINDEYQQTDQILKITKDFVVKECKGEVSATDQIDLLNRSVDYFKSHDNFDREEFEQEVFTQPSLIENFRSFDENYRTEKEIETTDNFEISERAVKKQERAFKKVLKLDKNFHIYIHGKKDLIEKGIETDGRKFYKIYYEEEK